jgi:hypothetical protein
MIHVPQRQDPTAIMTLLMRQPSYAGGLLLTREFLIELTRNLSCGKGKRALRSHDS